MIAGLGTVSYSLQAPQCGGGVLSVVKMDLLIAEDLIILVALARDENGIAGLGLGDGLCDGQGAVGDDERLRALICLKALLRIIEDLARVFRTWVVAGQDDPVGPSAGGLGHQRALDPVAVAPTAEDDDEFRRGPGQRA